MDFINGHGFFARVAIGTRSHPCLITPLIPIQVSHDGCGPRPEFHPKGIRVGLNPQESICGLDLKSIESALFNPWNEELPDS
jgi:hypothetical protein